MSAESISCGVCKYYEKSSSMCSQYETVVSRPTFVYKYCPMGEFMSPPRGQGTDNPLSMVSSMAEPVSSGLPPSSVAVLPVKQVRPVKKKTRKKKKKKTVRRAPEPGMVKVTDNSSAEGQTTH